MTVRPRSVMLSPVAVPAASSPRAGALAEAHAATREAVGGTVGGTASTGRVRPARRRPWTGVQYLYRDEYNNKWLHTVAFAGRLTAAEKRAFLKRAERAEEQQFLAHAVGLPEVFPWELGVVGLDEYEQAATHAAHELVMAFGPVGGTYLGDTEAAAWTQCWADTEHDLDFPPLKWDRYGRTIHEFLADLLAYWHTRQVAPACYPPCDPTRSTGAFRRRYMQAKRRGTPAAWRAYYEAACAKDPALALEAFFDAPAGAWSTLPAAAFAELLQHPSAAVRTGAMLRLGASAAAEPAEQAQAILPRAATPRIPPRLEHLLSGRSRRP